MPDSAADRVTEIYDRHAAAFEHHRDTGLMERGWLDAFLSVLPEAGGAVLDLGCGTGAPMADYLVARGCRITGIDGARAMIDRARVRLPEQRWIHADMRRLPSLGRFDGVLAWHSFFHLPPDDQPATIARFAGLTRPGAALMFTSGTEECERIGTFEGQPLYHGSLSPAGYRDLLDRAGFDVVDHVENDPDCGGATVWLARRR